MLVRQGLADAVISGVEMHYPESLRPVLQLLYSKEAKAPRAAGIYMLFIGNRVIFVADTTVNPDPEAIDLAECAIGTARLARQFGFTPNVAMLSHSDFGTNQDPSAQRVRQAVSILKSRDDVDFKVDGEMQADTALDELMLNELYSFNELKQQANVLIFPDMGSANIAYKLLIKLANAVAIGPILVGNHWPVNILERGADVVDIYRMTAITTVDWQEMNGIS
jgi:malate dehydrogenase (oxaloacetate-decarboxylating)(NADP+)